MFKIMTQKEKSEDLIHNIQWNTLISRKKAKVCALIAVDEVINSRPAITDSQVEYNNYWQQVKLEIKKL